MIAKLKWKELMNLHLPNNLFDEFEVTLEDIDDILNSKLGEGYERSNLKDMMTYINENILDGEQSIWKDLPIWSSTFIYPDRRYILLLVNKLREYIGFYYKILFDLLGGDFSMVALILTLTTISLLLTGFKEVRSWTKSFDAGMYLIYIFCLAMAMLADLSQLDWKLGLWVLVYQTIIVFGSLALGVLLARPCKVDADSAVITSDTLVNSPICVPMIAATMKNKNAIMVGITNGLAGYAVGNYLGYLMYNLLQLL